MYTRSVAVSLMLMLSVGATLASADQRPGDRIEVRVEDLPRPFETPSVSNAPRRQARPTGATLRLPPGFVANIFADDLKDARWMTVAPNGDVFLAEPQPGEVTLLRDRDGDGRADLETTFAQGFRRPHGVAIRGDHLYVADTVGIWRIRYEDGQTAAHSPAVRITPSGALGSGGGHWTRNIAFSPDGARIYVAIGSRGNIGEEPEPHATVQELNADGTGQRTFARGLRNPVGIAFYPGTTELYVVVNERDGLGDGLVPDYFTRLRRDGFYGWPYSYIGAHPQPGYASKRPDLVAAAIVPDLLFRSHSAPLGLVFYDGIQFPQRYRGDAFVALHGSWNSASPTGYKVVRVPFRDRRPVGYYENFATGFWFAGEERAQVWGRPAGLAVARDGSLLVADDVSNTIWRISYGP